MDNTLKVLIMTGLVGLLFKVVWDWLQQRKSNNNGNGNGLDSKIRGCIWDIKNSQASMEKELDRMEETLQKLLEQSFRHTSLLEQIANKK